MVGTHPDVDHVTTEAMTISVETARTLVLEAAAAPSLARWRVIVLEDADRLTEHANNALLKSLEEPTPHTVWLLCAPSLEDVLPDHPVAVPTCRAGHADGSSGGAAPRRA